MRRLESPGDSDGSIMDRYLVESKEDVENIISQVALENSLTTNMKLLGINYLPHTYPYVLMTYVDQEHNFIDMAFVTLADFQ